MKHLSNFQVTVHGLDTGIHAGMTAFLARQDLCMIKAHHGIIATYLSGFQSDA